MKGVTGACVVVAMLVTPAVASFFDSFTYPDGALREVSGGVWTGIGEPRTDNSVVSGVLKVRGNDDQVTYEHVDDWPSVTQDPVNGTVTTTIQVMAGSGGSNIVYFYTKGISHGDIGYWYGSGSGMRARSNDGVAPAAHALSGAGIWDTLTMVADFTQKKTFFYFNGVPEWTSPVWSVNPTQLTGIEVHRYGRTGISGQYVYFDNVSVTPEPASLTFLVLGGLLLWRRR